MEDLLPSITTLINASIREDHFPSSLKCAIVTPILKKPSLDPNDPNNYRPVSNLSFISKILERCVYAQLYAHLQDHQLLPEKQSAYRRHHSTETAVLDVMSDVLMAANSGQATLLGLLDQSAAFDVIDHDILMERLDHSFGLTGHVLAWIRSYLIGRSQGLSFNGEYSTITPLICCLCSGFCAWSTIFPSCTWLQSSGSSRKVVSTYMHTPTTYRSMPMATLFDLRRC